jgi:steroid delta-isomerase-like uncharacterized protein
LTATPPKATLRVVTEPTPGGPTAAPARLDRIARFPKEALMAAIPETVERADLTPTEERNLRAVTDVLQFWNTQDIEGMLTFYDDDITWTNVALEETYRGKDEVRVFLRKLFTAIPDLNFEVTHKFVRDNQVSERWVIRGAHRGPFMGIPPTGKPLEIPGIGMVQMRDGKFLRDWFLLDASAGLRQMGLLPPLSASEMPLMRAALWAAVHRKLVAMLAAGLAVAGVLGRRVRRER